MTRIRRGVLPGLLAVIIVLTLFISLPYAEALAISPLAVTSGGSSANTAPPSARTAVAPDPPPFVPGELIVKFKNGKASGDLKPHMLGRLQSFEKKRFSSKGDSRFDNIFKVKTRESDLEQLSRDLQDDPAIEYAGPNHILTVNFVPNDPGYPQQWSHARTQAESGWNINRGNNSTVIAIIDTGVDYNHEDLAANIWHDPQGHPGKDFVDIDTSAYIGASYQLISGEDYTVIDDNPADFHGHGTHCAGIAGAKGNNSIGISGTCPDCAIMPVRAGFAIKDENVVYGALEEDDIAAAVTYAIDNGADVISMSFGGQFGPLGISAFDYAYSQGVVLIAAAGNDNSSTTAYALPGALDNVIGVAGTNSADQKAYYSNYGTWVDVAAPGGDNIQSILSTVPLSGTLGDPSGYRGLYGTSMAAPYISGVAGLILSKNPLWTNNQVYAILRQGIDIYNQDIFPPADVYIGTGRVNVSKALSINTVTNATAAITEPGLYFLAGSSFNVTGTATAPYQVFRGEGIYPASLTEIGSGPAGDVSVAVDLDQIASPFATYTFKLRAGDSSGWIEDFVSGDIGKKFLPGWPQSNSSTPSISWNGPALADVDNDSFDEIVTTGRNADYQAIVSVHRRDGTLVTGWPQAVDGVYTSIQSGVAVGDINNDGVQELIASVTSSFYPGLYCWNSTGERLWKVVLDPLEPSETVALADVNGDGFLEIITKTRQKDLFVVDRGGTPLWLYPLDYHSLDLSFESSAAADLNNDGHAEIMTSVPRQLSEQPGDSCLPFGGTLYVFNGDGTVRWQHDWPEAADLAYSCRQIYPVMSPVVADVDLDGRLEIITRISAWTGDSNMTTRVYVFDDSGSLKAGWPRTISDFWQFGNLSLGDVNLDGYPEIIAATADNLYVFNSAGDYLFPPIPYGSESDPLVGDVTGDGVPDILLYENKTFRVVEASGTTSILPPRLNNAGGNVNNTPILTDLDHNGSLDLIFSENGNRNSLSAWDIQVPRTESAEQWSMFGFDSQHTFRYVPKTIPAPDLPDLFGYNMYGPSTVQTPATVTLNAWVSNTRQVTSGPFTVNFYVSADQTISAVDTLICQAQMGGLGPLDFDPASCSGLLSVAPGTYWWGAIVDEPRAIRETNEGNNTALGNSVSVTFAPGHAPPVANNQAVTTNEDTAKAITLTATDPDSPVLTYTVVAQPAHGTLTGTPPSVTYTPAANYNGADSFTFKANDPFSDSNIATVSITVVAVNDPPVANNQAASTNEDTATVITLTATDIDSPVLNYFLPMQTPHGTLTGTPPNVIYTPAANYLGFDSFSYTVSDGSGGTAAATVSITVVAVNDPPIANNQGVATNPNTAKAITLTATDVDGPIFLYSIVLQPVHGTLTGIPPFVTYTPAVNFTGADAFTFKFYDGLVYSDVATVLITVGPGNNPPVANNQAVATKHNTPKNITLTATDVESPTLTYTVVMTPVFGMLMGEPPNVTYAPYPFFSGTDSFTFMANDGTVDSALATVSITVAANNPPVANNQAVTTNQDMPKTITLTAIDIETPSLTYVIVTQPLHGAFFIEPPNAWYHPEPFFSGTDSFTYKVNDGFIDSALATVSITVVPINYPPQANNQTVTTYEDTSKVITLVATDPDSPVLTYAIVAQPAHGTLSGTPPNVTCTPAANFNGTDSFTFKANDGFSNSNIATVSMTVVAVNDRPVANNQSVTTNEDVPKAITLTATDVDSSNLTYTIVAQPAHGVLIGTPPNVTYSPAANYFDADSFIFKASDGLLDSAIATVSITIAPVNDQPLADNQAVTTNEDESIAITLTATDIDSPSLTYTIVTQPAHGTLTGTSPNVTYAPAANFNGADSFTFKANDGLLDSAIADVSITVWPVNDLPTADAGLDQTGIVDQVLTFSSLNSSDIDGTIVSYVWNWGDGTPDDSGRTATHVYKISGDMTVTLTVTDDLGATGVDTAQVAVSAPVNLALNKPASASSTRSGGSYTAAKAVDGSLSTSWMSSKTSGNQWVRVDLGSSLSIANIKVFWSETYYAKAFQIQTSTDGSYWTPRYSTTTGTGTVASAVFPAASARYVRVSCTTPNNTSYYAVAELEVYATAPPNQPPTADAGSDQSGTVGQVLSFSGAGSSDPDGVITSYSWNWGDDTTDGSGVNATHEYATAGIKTVTLTVTDSFGTAATDTALVTVSTPPPVNLALNKPASASTTRGSSYAAAKAVDGRSSTSWMSKNTNGTQWVRVDLRSSLSISNVKVFWPETYYAKAFQIQTSTDGTTYTNQYSTASGDGSVTDVTFNAVSARYVRVSCTDPNNASYYGVAELEVYQ